MNKIKLSDLIKLIEVVSWDDQFEYFDIERAINLLITLNLIKVENINIDYDHSLDLFKEDKK